MIFDALFDIGFWICDKLLSLLQVVSLPIDLVGGMATFISYGSYVVGTDLLLIFAGAVFVWTNIKLAWGMIVWIWKLLPFT